MSVHLYTFGDRIDAYAGPEAARTGDAPLAVAARDGATWSVTCGELAETVTGEDAARERLRDLAEAEAARRDAAGQARADLHGPPGPAGYELVWLSTTRQGIDMHLLADPLDQSTACGRDARRGQTELAAAARERYGSGACPRCWPPNPGVAS